MILLHIHDLADWLSLAAAFAVGAGLGGQAVSWRYHRSARRARMLPAQIIRQGTTMTRRD